MGPRLRGRRGLEPTHGPPSLDQRTPAPCGEISPGWNGSIPDQKDSNPDDGRGCGRNGAWRGRPGGSGGHGHQLVLACRGTSGLQHSATLAFRAAAPDAVLDAVGQRVLQARRGDGAVCTDQLGYLDADAVVGKEDLGIAARANPPCNPDRVQGPLFSTFSSAPPVIGVFLPRRTENLGRARIFPDSGGTWNPPRR